MHIQLFKFLVAGSTTDFITFRQNKNSSFIVWKSSFFVSAIKIVKKSKNPKKMFFFYLSEHNNHIIACLLIAKVLKKIARIS